MIGTRVKKKLLRNKSSNKKTDPTLWNSGDTVLCNPTVSFLWAGAVSMGPWAHSPGEGRRGNYTCSQSRGAALS